MRMGVRALTKHLKTWNPAMWSGLTGTAMWVMSRGVDIESLVVGIAGSVAVVVLSILSLLATFAK